MDVIIYVAIIYPEMEIVIFRQIIPQMFYPVGNLSDNNGM